MLPAVNFFIPQAYEDTGTIQRHGQKDLPKYSAPPKLQLDVGLQGKENTGRQEALTYYVGNFVGSQSTQDLQNSYFLALLEGQVSIVRSPVWPSTWPRRRRHPGGHYFILA